jgi:D-alanyl-D-alanine endopeptidase (penicillin-binding protein 7)
MHRFLLILLLLSSNAFAITAKSFIVQDMNGTVIVEQNADEHRSIASITKLVTVQRAASAPPEELIEITRDDVRDGHMRSSPLRAGQSYPRSLLIQLALVNSDNVAALALGRTNVETETPSNFTIVEASGLNPENKTSARALAEYARKLYNTAEAAISVERSVDVGKITRRSTNPLIDKQGWEFYLSKTGFINASGGCLVVITRVKDQLVTVVLLGSRDTHQRWRDLVELRQKLGDSNFYALNEAKRKLHRRGHP